MTTVDETNYASLGVTIRTAMLRAAAKNPPSRNQPLAIPWGNKLIQTVDVIPVPEKGLVRGEFLAVNGNPDQGFDVKVDGCLLLANGEQVALLRTWYDPLYEPAVEYEFHSKDGFLRVWNVYKMRYPRGRVHEEKWTENAGFWVETVCERERIYHCSHGAASPPDFGSLVFKITINP